MNSTKKNLLLGTALAMMVATTGLTALEADATHNTRREKPAGCKIIYEPTLAERLKGEDGEKLCKTDDGEYWAYDDESDRWYHVS
jgi:hypothetical protein